MRKEKVIFKKSRPELFLGEGVLKICWKFTGEHPCRSAISIKLVCKFFVIAILHGCSPLNLLFSEHFFLGTPLGHCSCLLFVLYALLSVFRLIFFWSSFATCFLQSNDKWKYAFNTKTFISDFTFLCFYQKLLFPLTTTYHIHFLKIHTNKLFSFILIIVILFTSIYDE